MPRAAALVLVVVVLVGAGGLIWWRANRPVALGPVPLLVDTAGLDPLVREAIDEAVAAALADPDGAETRARLAMTYHANGHLEQAIGTYQQALAGNADPVNWWYLLALARAEAGRYEEALATMDEAVRRQPDDARMAWRRGFWLMELGRLDEAMLAFRRAGDLDPTDAAPLFGQARVQLLRGEPAAAAALLERILARVDHGYAHQLLGRAYHQLGRTEEAADHLRRSSLNRVDWNDPWKSELTPYRTGLSNRFSQIDAMVARGDTDGALQGLDELRRLFPGNATVLAKIGETYADRGDWARARQYYERALEADDTQLIALVQLARVYRAEGRPDLALQRVERAIALQPSFSHAHLEAANVHAVSQRWAEAEASLREAMHLGRDGSSSRILLAYVQEQQGRPADAVATLAQVVTDDPGQFDALLRLARLHGAMGERTKANQRLAQAARLRPNDPAVAETSRAIEAMANRPAGANP